MNTVEVVCFDNDLEFGIQQLIPNFQVIMSSSQTPRDFSKQSTLNPTFGASNERTLGLLI